MKGHSEKKVSAEMVKPAATEEVDAPVRRSADFNGDAESLRELQEQQIDNDKFKRKRDSQMGKVAQMLGASVKVTDWTFPFLHMNDRQLAVTEWYPELFIVVDKFFSFGPEEEKIVAFKKEAFATNTVQGKTIKYGYLTPSMELYDLADQLQLVDEEPA